MPTAAALIAQYETQKVNAERAASDAKTLGDKYLKALEANGLEHMTAEQQAHIEGLAAKRRAAVAEIRQSDGAIKALKEAQADDNEYMRRASESHPNAVKPNRRTATARIGSEAHTYRAPAERNNSLPNGEVEPSFLQDLYKAQIRHDPNAMGRLERHGTEMLADRPELFERATATTVIPGFIPPQYLEDDFAAFARAGRPTANLCTSRPLPAEGMETDLPRVTTPTATGVQASENAALTNQDVASTLLTNPVVSIGGYIVLSRQAVERGRITEQVVMADLAADYNSRLDIQVLNGSGSSGQHRGFLNVSGINAVTFTSATPTIQLLWPKLASAVGQVVSGRFTGPTAIVMSPTQWVWMLAATDSQGRPFIAPESVALNPLATSGGIDYSTPAGNLFGTTVYLDGNMPANLGASTTETRIIVADFRDSYLYEDGAGAPTQLHFEAPAAQNLGVLLVAYGYSSAALGRQPKAISVVSGTGLITPAL
jgi:HK97 family phage major capsid protein